MRSGFCGGGVGPVALKRRSGVWYTANGAIPLTNIAEYVVNPMAGQLYGGVALSDAWSISFRTTLASVPASNFAFDSEIGRIVLGIISGNNGYYVPAGWQNIGLFTTGDHTYMLISTGSSVQAYRDNVAIGAAVADGVNLQSVSISRWRSNYSSAASNVWPSAIVAGHIANIALDAMQRSALHMAMMAL